MVAAGILLGATLSILGWEIQSYKGRTLPERVNRWLYRSLYVLGTFLLVLALSWQGRSDGLVAFVEQRSPTDSFHTVAGWILNHGVALLALVVAGVVLYKQLLERPRIAPSLGSSIHPVAEGGTGKWVKIHLYVVLSNRARNAGVVDGIHAKVRYPDGRLVMWEWDIFFKTLSSYARDDESMTIPVSVPGNSSVLKGVQFKTQRPVSWLIGRYELYVTISYFGGLLWGRHIQSACAYWFEVDNSVQAHLNNKREEAIRKPEPKFASISLRE